MADQSTHIPQLAASQANKETTINELVDALSPAALYGRNAETTTGLTWGYLGGRYQTLAIANGTIALSASATNYVEADTTTGAVSKNTTGWTGSGKKKLYKITTGASSVTNYEDFREVEIPPSGMTNPMTTAGDIITGGASGAPQRLAVGANGKVLTVVSGAPAWSDPAAASLQGTATGNIDMADYQLSRGMLKDMGNVFVDKGNSGTTTQTLDYTAGSHQKITATGNHTIATSNWPPSGNLGELLLELVNGGAYTITWPTVNWIKSDGSTTTTFSSNGVTLQSSGTDWVYLWSRDGGTTIYGKIVR
jgi:hypothetical protein